jgi:hypothetical protein
MSEERVLAALRALKEADEERDAPPELEARALAAYRRKRSQRIWKHAAAWAVAAAAASVALAVLVPRNAHRPIVPPPPGSAAGPAVALAPPQVPPRANPPPRTNQPKNKPEAERTVHREQVATVASPPGVSSSISARPRFERRELVRSLVPEPAVVKSNGDAGRPESVTPFYSLMDVQPPFERGELLRVVVPASTMRTVGLRVDERDLKDPVQADILVGQEGLARAIRFVDVSSPSNGRGVK